jgi:SAM-dependent methyltransferase
MMSKPKNVICPSCNTRGMVPFYEAKNVPVNSCMMFSNHKDATSFPRGDVILGFCQACGFISNMAFDPKKLDYSSLAPEEQGFSGTFNTFIQRLATRLINTYNLHDKHISEIGCGRGDFLALLSELGHNYGVGIDPSTVSGGVQSQASNRLTFIRDYYSERYAKYLGDLVCCRHTLEHIHNTAEFISALRNAIGDNLNAAVFFEVPDITRILQEVAFWDIYYEHCSYFSLGSLARLFRSCKFEITNLVKDYFDQYLLIDAKPVNTKSEKIYDVEESVDEMVKNVESFSSRCQEKLDFWRNQMQQIKKEKKRAIVWGSGSKCVAFMTTLHVTDEVEYIVDINPHRHGKFIPGVGKQIVSPEFLKTYKPDTVIVMNPVYCNEIKQMLDNMEIKPEFIPCT